VTQALVGALSTTQTRLAAGIADAEAELVRARSRCRELRETLALARAREAAAVVTPVREPDVRERQKRVRQLIQIHYTLKNYDKVLSLGDRAVKENFADDEINPPEQGVMEEQIKRVARGRYVLIPLSERTRGHRSAAVTALWQQYLEELLARSGR